MHVHGLYCMNRILGEIKDNETNVDVVIKHLNRSQPWEGGVEEGYCQCYMSGMIW